MRRCAQFAAALTVVACLTIAGCTGHTRGDGTPHVTSGRAPSSAAATTSSAAQACPPTYRSPDPNRPTVSLAFTVSKNLATVAGSEHITFTPDRPINQLVFRLTANTAPTVAAGNKIVVRSARADHGGGTPTYTRGGASPTTQGGLLHIPFVRTVAAGTTVSADITFTVALGLESFDRFGRVAGSGGEFAWFGSAQPLLAWQRGYGWHTEPMADFTAESTTSEAMRTDLTVTAPSADTVIMSGDPGHPRPAPGGNRVWHASIAAARDVSVAVGPFQVSDTTVGPVHLRVGAYDAATLRALVPEFRVAITDLVRRFGPFPFPSLSVARLPLNGGGIEYPSSILMLASSQLVAVHETAHQWFYAMVGDSQALHPWLDEAFASYAEQLVDGDPPPASALTEPGRVDASTASYGADARDYYRVTYDKGAAALHAARAAAGPAKFDAAIRCYLNANAWQIADPSDLASALGDLPAALTVLRKAQALP